MMEIQIGDRMIGDGRPCYIVAELGINHNGSLDMAKRMIDAAKDAGADAVKLQKRTIEKCYTEDELRKPRESPWGSTTRQQKEGLELSIRDYVEIRDFCSASGIDWFASCWDEDSVANIEYFKPIAYKVASASITDHALLREICSYQRPVPILLSTGMSTLEEIDDAVALIRSYKRQLVLMHCTSIYPCRSDEINLRCIQSLRQRYNCLVGYSGHELGLQTTLAAVALGACVVERHFTIDRSMYGSDQSASVEPQGFALMVRDIREIEAAMGDGVKRVYERELPVKAKLRRV